MAGRHLRRRPGPDPRTVAVGLVALVLGLLTGAAAALALDGGRSGAVVGAVAPPSVEAPGALRSASAPAGVAALVPDPAVVTLAFVGDVNVERSLADRLARDPAGFVGPFAPLLHDADLVVANLEAALADGGTAVDKEFVFRAPVAVLDALAAGGVDVVSVANNHGLDQGPDGLAETLAAKAARDDGRSDGAVVVGVGADEDEAYAPLVRDVAGVRVAVLAATQVLDADRIREWTAGPDQPGLASAKRVDRLVRAVSDAGSPAGAGADVVVVFLHWGVEGQECPTAGQQELAEALVEAGADVVAGTHAHRVQGGGRLLAGARAERERTAVVHHGLGNFLFGAASEASARTGVWLVDVDAGGVVDHRWVPGRIVDRVPRPLDGEAAEAEAAAWAAQRSCTGLAP